MSTSSIQLKTFLPYPYNGRGVGYTCGQLLTQMSDCDLVPFLFTPYSRSALSSCVQIKQTLSPLWGKVLYRFGPKTSRRATESALLKSISPKNGDVAYLWNDTSLEFAKALKKLGVPVVREETNCSRRLSKRVLDDAYHRIGETPQHGITDAAVENEESRFRLADAIYCPSPMVENALTEIGIDNSILLSTSYGFSPDRLKTQDRLLDPIDGVTFLFVGTICVRKGAHLILEAWAKSGIKGRLVLAGAIEPVIARRCAVQLARPDVLRLEFVKNVGALYNSADVFVFPSLEEGGPQVTYEAAACGLPAIVSPMGAGRFTRSKTEGLIVDPYDLDGWVDAMRELATNTDLRGRLSRAARTRSSEFDWSSVGSKRRDLLKSFLNGKRT